MLLVTALCPDMQRALATAVYIYACESTAHAARRVCVLPALVSCVLSLCKAVQLEELGAWRGCLCSHN